MENEKLVSEQKSLIQGYIPVITNQGKENFVTFKGKLTTDFLKAYCTSVENAFNIASNYCKIDGDIPSVLPINGLCEIVR